MEADTSGVTAKNAYGGPLLLRTEFNGDAETTYEYLYNAHGDVVTLLSDGAMAATYYYDSFGNILEQTGEVSNSILYAGYQYDEETGLYYINARMYDPVTARFLQADTYAGSLNDPLSLNLYTYCLNNPHKYVDPSGHFAITLAIAIGAVIWGLVGAAIEYKMQKDAGGMIDYNQVLFYGVLNAGIALISGGLANGAVATAQGARMTVGTFGRMLLAETALGIAEGVIGETGYQLINGTKVSDLDVGRIAFSGVRGGISGAGGAFIGEGIGAGMRALKNSRMVSKAAGHIREYANVLKGGDGNSRLGRMDLQFFASDEVYQGVGGKDSYVGVREASQYLKDMGMPRYYRKDILESFDVRTIKVERAKADSYGIRFYGGNAKANGPYLFETFTPQTNRTNLALPPEWNAMSGIKQWKIKEGTSIFTGRAASQLQFGSQYVGGAKQIWVPNPKTNLMD